MRNILCRLLLLFVGLPVLLLLTGCEDANNVGNGQAEWDVSSETTPDEEEIIRDTAYVVVEKRQAGGKLEPTGEVSQFDGRPRMIRTPLESMIIVEGDMTGQRSAYLLPETDYNVVRVGNRLQESTLARWESTGEDHIPPPPPPPESGTQRSRTGGAAEQFVY